MTESLENVRVYAGRWEAARTAERVAHWELVKAIRRARETHSLAQIAAELGVSRQRVEQLSRENVE